jgi:uncharacterized repeat protein (TIGR03843 family)
VPEDEREQAADHLKLERLDSEAYLEILSAGEIELLGRLPWSSNYSYLVEVSCGEAALRAVYKPGKGERLLWDFGPDLFRREVAAYELSSALGLALVPETVLRLDGPLGAGSLQRFVAADFEHHYFSIIEDDTCHPQLRQLAGLDLFLNNADRKSGHVLIDSDRRIWGIDNGLSFHSQAKLRTVMWDFAGEALPDAIVEAAAELAGAVPRRVASLITEDEVEALSARARVIRRTRRFPAPRDDYRSYPWPLI